MTLPWTITVNLWWSLYLTLGFSLSECERITNQYDPNLIISHHFDPFLSVDPCSQESLNDFIKNNVSLKLICLNQRCLKVMVFLTSKDSESQKYQNAKVPIHKEKPKWLQQRRHRIQGFQTAAAGTHWTLWAFGALGAEPGNVRCDLRQRVATMQLVPLVDFYVIWKKNTVEMIWIQLAFFLNLQILSSFKL